MDYGLCQQICYYKSKKEVSLQEDLHAEDLPAYDLPDMKQEAAGGLGMVEIKAVRDSDNEDDDSPPGH